jgi:hypothetical protein
MPRKIASQNTLSTSSEFGVADAPGIESGVSPWSIHHGDTEGIKAQLRVGTPMMAG